MNRKVLFGLAVLGAAMLTIGRRRRSALSGLGFPAVRHALFRVSQSGASGVHLMAAKRYADEGDCKRAVHALYEAEYLSGQSSAHATSTADEFTQRALDPAHGPRVQAAEAKKLRKAVELTRRHIDARCVIVPRRDPPRADPRQGTLLGVR